MEGEVTLTPDVADHEKYNPTEVVVALMEEYASSISEGDPDKRTLNKLIQDFKGRLNEKRSEYLTRVNRGGSANGNEDLALTQTLEARYPGSTEALSIDFLVQRDNSPSPKDTTLAPHHHLALIRKLGCKARVNVDGIPVVVSEDDSNASEGLSKGKKGRVIREFRTKIPGVTYRVNEAYDQNLRREVNMPFMNSYFRFDRPAAKRSFTISNIQPPISAGAR